MAGDYDYDAAFQFPGPEEGADRIITYRDKVFSKYATYRRRLEIRWAMAVQYLIDNQWLDVAAEAIPDASGTGFALKILQSERDGVPRPVTNILAPNIEIELATYNKRKFTPKVVATTSDPRDIEAARRNTDVLRYRAREERWNVVRQRAALYMATTGTGGLRSYWDETYLKTTEVGSPYAMECSSCGAKVFSPQIQHSEQRMVKHNSDRLKSVGADPMTLELGACPSCPNPEPLRPAQLNQADLPQKDLFDRRLGLDLPIGEPSLEALDPFVMYPENGGVGVTYEGFQVMHTVTARSLDWIYTRHPNFTKVLRPDSQSELLRRNPLLGQFSAFGWYAPSIDSSIYRSHALYYEMWCLPNHRMPKGWLIRSANNYILDSGPLLWDYTDQHTGKKRSIPRVQYSAGIYLERPGEFFGHGIVDRGKSLQNRLNGSDAQITDINQRMADPHILAATDLNIAGPEWFQGSYSGKLMQYERSPLAPEDRPQHFGGVSPPPGLWQARKEIKEDVRLILGPAEIEVGGSPKNVSTTSGLQLQSENAEQRRSPREDSLDHMATVAWEHHMYMEQGFRVDQASYEVEDPATKKWRTEVYSRIDLQGNMRLELEKTAYVAKSIYDREAAREAMADGLYVINKPADRKRLLELRGLPSDVNQDENFQVDSANEKWAAFCRDGSIPVIDPTLDKADIHWDVLSTNLMSEEGKRLTKLANWPAVVPLLTDWEILLQQRIQLDQLSRQAYGMWTKEEDALQMYAGEMLAFQEASAGYDERAMQYNGQAALGAIDPNTGLPPLPPLQPVEPIKPIFLPRPMDKKVLTVWKELLEGQPVVSPEGFPPTQDFQEVLNKFLRFRAVVEAYRLMSLNALAPPLPPPGPSPASGAGVVPNPPNPQQPQNTPSPGTSLAMANSGQAIAQPGTVAGGPNLHGSQPS